MQTSTGYTGGYRNAPLLDLKTATDWGPSSTLVASFSRPLEADLWPLIAAAYPLFQPHIVHGPAAEEAVHCPYASDHFRRPVPGLDDTIAVVIGRQEGMDELRPALGIGPGRV